MNITNQLSPQIYGYGEIYLLMFIFVIVWIKMVDAEQWIVSKNKYWQLTTNKKINNVPNVQVSDTTKDE